MKLPVPGPRDLFGALERGADQIEALLGMVPRVVALLDQAEAVLGLAPRLVMLLDRAEMQLGRVGPLINAVEAVREGAAREVAQVGRVVRQARSTADQTGLVVAQAQGTADQTDAVVAQAQALVDRLTPLLEQVEPPLTRLQPTLEVLADTTDPDEVAALVSMVNRLPALTGRVEDEVLPLVSTLATVAPDLHDLLAVSSELNEIIGKLPGLGRIKRRVEEEQEDEQNAS